MSIVDEDEVRARQTAAMNLLLDTFEIGACHKCDLDYELGLVLGDDEFAVGVAVCPNCGYYGQDLIADPEGKFSDSSKYQSMVDAAMTWTPDWHPGIENIHADWSCACGKTWTTMDEANRHVYRDHPDRTTLSLRHHDRAPWDTLAAEVDIEVEEPHD